MKFETYLKHICATLCAMACISLLAGLDARAQSEQSIVALVNDEPITNYDVTQRMRLLKVTARKEPSAALRKQVIEDLVSERIQVQEATKNGVVVSDDQVNQVLDRVASSNKMNRDQLMSSLAQLGVNGSTMKEQIRSRLAWRSVVQRKFRGQVSVNASQVDEALSEEKPAEGKKKKKSTEFQLQRVRLELPESPDQRTIAKRFVEAEQLRKRVTSCSKIEQVVGRLRKTSVKSVGRKTAQQLVQPTRAILLATEDGRLTPPTITSAGIELYAVCARRAVARNDEQRREVRTKLISQEYNILARRHLRDLRQDAFVEYR
ncbi:MAG: SurA N-terminal domain-containing protein [Hyphomicrobiaceae bacterium]|nr:SurA N-terminal domain-containing protein [Hyphomicrobiaceae bacterium]